ncbi:hypothetical protein UT300013_33370 [Paraclostridium sordellii]
MAVNNFHFNVDIEKEDYIPKCKLKQYDTAIFYASLYKNGLPYHFEGEKIKMFVKKSDGTIVYQEDNITIQDDEVKINVKNQALTASGLTYAELELRSLSGQVTTATFLFEVKKKVGSDDAIESITDICTLEKLDKYVGQAKKELDKFKQDLSKLEDLVSNKDKLEGQNTEAKVNIKGLERVLEQANNIVDNGGKKVIGNNVVSESSSGYIQDIKLTGKTSIVNNLNKEVEPGTIGATLKSVGDGVDEIEILSNNLGNMLDKSKIIKGGYLNKNNGNIQQNTNSFYTDYFIEINSSFKNLKIRNNQVAIFTYYDNTKNFISGEELNSIQYASIPKNAKYMKISFYNRLNIIDSLYVGFSKDNSNIKYKQDKTYILFKNNNNWSKPILRKWDTIEDHLDGNYYYHKRSSLRTLNGSGDWKDNGTTSGGFSTFYIRGFSNIKNFKIICDKYNYHTTPKLDAVGISSINDILYLTVKTNYASTVAELKTKLRSNNINLVFEDVEKIYECLNISVRSFNPKTLLYVSGGAIDPEVEYYIPSSFVSSDSSISEKVEILDKYIEDNRKDIYNIEKNYFNVNRGILTDFNNGIKEGKYYLHSSSLIPNSPPTSQTGLFGIVQVFYKNENELFQIVTLHNTESWIRFRNGRGEWNQWNKVPDMRDFESRYGQHGYQKLPGGLIIQWGSMTIHMSGNVHSAKQDIVYPVAFKNPAFFVTGNIDNVDGNGEGITNDFTLHVFNLDRVAGATVVINNVLNPYGTTANIKWYAIGV